MQITDPIADLLTRIRNASTAKHPSVDIPASNLKKAICQILVDEGYIKGMKVTEDNKQGTITLTLKYQENGTPVIAGLKRVSKPGLRIYTNCEDMPKVMKGLGLSLIHISEPTRLRRISYAVFCLKKKKEHKLKAGGWKTTHV